MESYSSSSGSSRSRRSFTSSTGTTPGDQGRAVGGPVDLGDLDVVLVGDLAHELLEEILEGDDAGGAAVLVDGDGEVDPLLAHLPQQIAHALGLGDEAGRPGERADGSVAVAVALGPHEVLEVGDTDHVVDRGAGHGEPAEPVEDRDLDDVGNPEVAGDGHHVGPWDHHLADDRVAELEQGLDELALLGFDLLGLHGHVGDGEQLLLGDERPRLQTLAREDHVGQADEARARSSAAAGRPRGQRRAGRPATPPARCAGWPRSSGPPRPARRRR